MERFAEDADLIGALREQMWSSGLIVSKVRTGKKTEGEKFKDYFDFSEPLTKLPSHRILALFRGEKEEILDLQLLPDAQPAVTGVSGPYELKIMQRFAISDQGRPGDRWLSETVRWAWRTRIQMHLGIDLRMRLWTQPRPRGCGCLHPICVTCCWRRLPGPRITMGLDPGFRSGVKVAVVDATGKVVTTTAVYPHEPQRRWDESLATLGKLAVAHKVDLIAIGNGTASRETDKLAMELVKLLPDLKMSKIVVSEAGASVYSASAFASEELPELDVTMRGAVSIARAPAGSAGRTGEDRSQGDRRRAISARPRRNQAGALARCGGRGLRPTRSASMPTPPPRRCWRGCRASAAGLAQSIVQHRDANGLFKSRKALKEVPRLGPKAFEQCAGFLRINDGEDPLDASGVHRRPIRWCGGFSLRPRATSRR